MNDTIKKMDEEFRKAVKVDEEDWVPYVIHPADEVIEAIHARDAALIDAIAEAVGKEETNPNLPDKPGSYDVEMAGFNRGVRWAVEIIYSFGCVPKKKECDICHGSEKVWKDRKSCDRGEKPNYPCPSCAGIEPKKKEEE